jgi:hypothetical protein
VAATLGARLGSCASKLHDKPRKATPKTSRTTAPTLAPKAAPIKPDCIHSPVLRAGAGRHELPKRQIGSGERCSDHYLSDCSCQIAFVWRSAKSKAVCRLFDYRQFHMIRRMGGPAGHRNVPFPARRKWQKRAESGDLPVLSPDSVSVGALRFEIDISALGIGVDELYGDPIANVEALATADHHAVNVRI